MKTGLPWRTILLETLVLSALILLPPSASAKVLPAATIIEYAVPPEINLPGDITLGPGGNLWFTGNGPYIGSITISGEASAYLLSDSPSFLGSGDITLGQDNALWFAESHGSGYNGWGYIGRFSPPNDFTEWSTVMGWGAHGLTKGPDGNLWYHDGRIVRMNPDRTYSIFPITPWAAIYSSRIATGPDGNLWFPAMNTNINSEMAIVRMSPLGDPQVFPLSGHPGVVNDITAGPDGNLWFTESLGKVGRITTKGEITEFALPSASYYPDRITPGPDGNLWFTVNMYHGSYYDSWIGRMNTSGALIELITTPVLIHGNGITTGPDGNIWFVEGYDNKIAKLLVSSVSPTYSISGRVTDDCNNPISGVTISDGRGDVATTDSNGNYVLGGLASGSYTLTPSKENFSFSSPSFQVTVPTTSNPSFTGRSIYSISGHLRDNSNQPIPGVSVQAASTTSVNHGGFTTSDANGCYTFANLATDTYRVRPFTSAYAFTPAWKDKLVVPVGAAGQDFTGTPTLPNYSVDVTPLWQDMPPWGNQDYDSFGTIGGYGCLLTDYTMLINFFGQLSTSHFETDPLTLNTWLMTPAANGYSKNPGEAGFINPGAPLPFATAHGVPLYWDSWSPYSRTSDGVSDEILDWYLQHDRPVILQEDGHFVLAIGKVTDSTGLTYAIIDPARRFSTLRGYGNKFINKALYSPGTASHLASLYIGVASPLQFLVTDPNGRRTGYDPKTGNMLDEIPQSSYITQTLADALYPNNPTTEIKGFYTGAPMAGPYRVNTVGTGSGSYTLTFIGTNQIGASTSQVLIGQTTLGQTKTYQITYTPTGGIGRLSFPLYLPFLSH